MQAHQLKKPKSFRTKKRVGRGGKRGTYSGRGVKGQKSRAGARIRPEIRDYIAKIPKLAGPTNKAGVAHSVRQKALKMINLSQIDMLVKDGDEITREFLYEKKFIQKKKGSFPEVKILANGKLTKKVTVIGLKVSSGARGKIEEAGGTVK